MNSDIDLKNFGSGRSPFPGAGQSTMVRPPRRLVTRYLIPLALLAGFVAVGAFAFRGSLVPTVGVLVTMPVMASDKLADASSPTASSDSVELHKESLFQAPGWIEPEPYPIVISTLRMGTVETINVIEGQSISSGTVVATLVDDDAKLAVASAESALKLKEAQYNAAVGNWENPTSLKEAVETARANADRLQAEARRLQEMFELARIEADVGNTLTRSGYEASLDTIRKETQLSASRNQLAETQAQIKLNSATLAAASERLALRIEDRKAVESAKAELMAARAALDTARLQLERSVIKAPTNGTIMRLYASPGSMRTYEMDNGMNIASLYQPERLQVRVDVPLSEAAKVRPGLDAEIKVEALPDRAFRGELVNIVPEFDLQKNILPVKVRIIDPVLELRPEMIARVEFFHEQERPAQQLEPVDAEKIASSGRHRTETLSIPVDLVQKEGDRNYVLLATAEGVAQRREIATAGKASEGMIAVSDGLRLSDKIITSPPNVPPGTAVTVKGFVEHASH